MRPDKREQREARQGKSKARSRQRRGKSRGITLVIVAFSMMLMLGIAGMAVDLGYLYCARSEAQQAADAAALAAANDFAQSGYTSGLITKSQVETLAAADAARVGNQNKIVGQNPEINPDGFSSTCPTPAGSDGCFDMSTTNDPQVTVVVQRTKERGDPMQLFFMNAFGIRTADVTATATAEAYDPSQGGGPPVNVQSLKPWLVPNCDQGHIVPADSPMGNPNCATSTGLMSYYVYPQGSANASQIANPGETPTGVVGEEVAIKPGSPSSAPTPSEFYPLYFPYSKQDVCPACVSTSTSSNGASSASLYESNIECMTPYTMTCGANTIQLASGNMVGPTSTGVDCLTHESNGYGQDTLDESLTPFQMLAGSANPYFPEGDVITTSDSVVTVPLYDGSDLCPGGSCASTVNVQGFLQLFIIQEGPPSGTVTAYVLNVGGCGNWQPSEALPASSAPADPVIVRLIHN